MGMDRNETLGWRDEPDHGSEQPHFMPNYHPDVGLSVLAGSFGCCRCSEIGRVSDPCSEFPILVHSFRDSKLRVSEPCAEFPILVHSFRDSETRSFRSLA